jgi:hypothetical protein
MKLRVVLSATLAIAGCGLGNEETCTVDSDVQAVAVGVPDSAVSASSQTAALRVGQSVDVCLIGRAGCTRIDQRFEFETDAPTVVSIATSTGVVSDGCDQLTSTHAYPCCYIRSGRLTAVGAGTARVQAVLRGGGGVEMTGGLIWCPPFGPGAGCRPLAGIEVTP